MLLLPVLLAGLLGGQPAQPDKAEAERLARSGMYAQALERFRQLAAENPDDLDARVWIGRLHVWMRHADAAEGVFRSVVESAPDRVDALVGLGVALTALARDAEAIAVLDRAERLAPNDEEVLAAQGAAHGAAGHTTLAEAYLLRAAVLRPEDRAIGDSLEVVRRDAANMISAVFMNESFSADVSDTRFGSVSVNLRANDRLRVTGRVDPQRKFARDEARGGGGLILQATPRVAVKGQVLFGGPSDVLPRGDVAAGVDVRHRNALWSGVFRLIRFDGADYVVFSPGVTLTLRDRTIVALSYSHSVTTFAGFEDRVGNNSGDVRLEWAATPRLWIGGGYTRNVERLDVLSPDRLGAFTANTGSASARLELRSLTTLRFDYDYQRRANGVRMIRIIGALVQRF